MIPSPLAWKTNNPQPLKKLSCSINPHVTDKNTGHMAELTGVLLNPPAISPVLCDVTRGVLIIGIGF